jgi:hypothetical protein
MIVIKIIIIISTVKVLIEIDIHRQIGEAAHARPESSERPMGAQCGSAKLTMAQGRSSIETYHVSTLERPELPTKTAEPWWPLRFADVVDYIKT